MDQDFQIAIAQTCLVQNHVDILFANEAEITALYETNTLAEAAAWARRDVALAALTMSENGSKMGIGLAEIA